VIRGLIIALVLFTAAVAQTSVFPHLAIGGFRPDLLLLATVAFAFRDGALTGLYVGFAAGLLADLLLAVPPVGINALVFLVIGYTVGVVRPYLASESVTAPLALALATGIIGIGGYGVVARTLGASEASLGLVLRTAVIVALYDTLLAPVVFATIRRLSGRYPPERAVQI